MNKTIEFTSTFTLMNLFLNGLRTFFYNPFATEYRSNGTFSIKPITINFSFGHFSVKWKQNILALY